MRNGNTIVVAIAGGRMVNSSSAIRLADLTDADGTGGIQPSGAVLDGIASVSAEFPPP